ncbi:MAG TPA: DUF6438 domain-containing protein [Gammaproteobacteria bacterium]|nr:DUF6438 domain-containing protein [Gammaproteobacteria bacterium]
MPRNTFFLLVRVAIIIVLAGALYWIAMPRQQAARQQPGPIPPDALHGFQVFLHHQPCIGGCAAYAVLVKGDSHKIRYAGDKNVATTGSVTAQASDQQLRALYRAVVQADFFSIADVYHPGGTGCEAPERGKPQVVIGVTRNKRTKVIHYDYGCRSAPPALAELVVEIDQILNTRRWTAGSAPAGR